MAIFDEDTGNGSTLSFTMETLCVNDGAHPHKSTNSSTSPTEDDSTTCRTSTSSSTVLSSTSTTASAAAAASASAASRDDGSSSFLSNNSKSVRFDTIEIRDYPLQLDGSGGIPTSGGAPLGISWKWIDRHTLHVDHFETMRDKQTGDSPRRPHSKLMALSSSKRTALLLESGFRMKDIVTASKECGKIQKKRSSSDDDNDVGAVLGKSSSGGGGNNATKPKGLWNKARENIKKMTGSSRTVATVTL
jgi:hypothetical protein